jgi:crotonobetainyl-CoA:carnitine CoA-transferase CaiB-like acyl-CoA transferase
VHRGLFETEDHPVTGPVAVPVLPFRFGSVDHWLRLAVPTLGQHNREVLGEVAGAAELADLTERGQIGERVSG